MKRKQPSEQAESITEFTRVGNIGCIRFPLNVRKAAGVKRGDRLAVVVSGPHSLTFAKVPDVMAIAEVEVEACACESPPDGCRDGRADVVTVGWSYVQLARSLAEEHGFLPGCPLRLEAVPAEIVATLVADRGAVKHIDAVKCPP